MAALRLFELRPSPNNMKVRIALRLKGLDFETVDVPFEDMERAEIVRLSGQPLTPMLMDGERAVWDSAAILRHLDTIAPQEPVLYGTEHERHHAVEVWESWARGEFYENFKIIPGMLFRGAVDREAAARSNATLREHSARIEEALDGQDYLLGDAPTAADLSLAPLAFYSMVPDNYAATNPLVKSMQELMVLGEGRERTRAWVGRIMANWN